MSLHIEKVSRRFGHRTVLDDVSLEVDGRTHLVGPNGAGKTTLLRICAGLLHPTQGRVTHQGISTLRPEGRRGIAYVGQDVPVYAELSPVEHLRWLASMHRVDPVDHLDDAGLGRHKHRPAGELSRGQRQRLGLALAFGIKPQTLLLDEPASALDGDGHAWLHTRLRDFSGTILMASHHPRDGDALDFERFHLEGP